MILLILGWTIAAVFGLLLLAVLAVLFCRLKYRVFVAKDNSDHQWKYNLRATWLFGIFRVALRDDKGFEVRILGKDRMQNPGKKAHRDTVSVPSKKAKALTKTKTKALDAKKSDKKMNKKKGKAKWLDSLRRLDKEYVKAVAGHTWGLLKELYVIAKPRRFRVHGIVGLEEPHTTGIAMAAISSVTTLLPGDINIAGDFEGKHLQLNVQAKGHLRVWAVLWPMVRYIRKPEIKRLIFGRNKKRRKGGKHGNRINQ